MRLLLLLSLLACLKAKYVTVSDIGPLSICCLSHGYISETKQDRPMVIMVHYWEVGTADYDATFISCPDVQSESYSGFKYKIHVCANLNAASDSGIRRQLLSTKQTKITQKIVDAIL